MLGRPGLPSRHCSHASRWCFGPPPRPGCFEHRICASFRHPTVKKCKESGGVQTFQTHELMVFRSIQAGSTSSSLAHSCTVIPLLAKWLAIAVPKAPHTAASKTKQAPKAEAESSGNLCFNQRYSTYQSNYCISNCEISIPNLQGCANHREFECNKPLTSSKTRSLRPKPQLSEQVGREARLHAWEGPWAVDRLVACSWWKRKKGGAIKMGLHGGFQKRSKKWDFAPRRVLYVLFFADQCC